MRVLRGLTVDNGGSEIRYMPETTDNILGNIETLSNDFYEIPEKGFREKDVQDRTALIRFVGAPKDEYLGIVAQGLTGRAYNGSRIFLSHQESKTGSLSYYRQFLFAVARDALNAAMKEKTKRATASVFRRDECVEDPEYVYVITTCIPIKEFSGNKDCAKELKRDLEGTYVVEFPLIAECPRVTFKINTACLGVTAEGGVVVYSIRKQLDERDFTLMVDMGHNTLDISLYKGAEPYGSVKSSGHAGTVLVGMLRSALEDEGYRLVEEQVVDVLKTGLVRKGIKDVDVSDIIKECKKSFVENYVKTEVLECLSMNRINSDSIQNTLFVGAPMKDRGVNSIPELIRSACKLGDARMLTLELDARYANLGAASVFTTKLLKKAKELNFV